MKIRNDFVTNSSSSSFIIAKHKSCTINELKEMLNKHRKNIHELLGAYDGDLYCEYRSDIRDAYNSNNFDKAIDLAIDVIVEGLWKDGWDPMRLDDWSVKSSYGSNEDGELFGCALYDFGWDMDTEHLKVMRGD